MKKVLLGILCLLIGYAGAFAETQEGDIYSQKPSSETFSNITPSFKLPFFKVSGKKTIAFIYKTSEGSSEVTGEELIREESLRINISGSSEDDAELHMNIISESSPFNRLSSHKDKEISIAARYASTEVYFGDYLSDFNDTEFTGLNKPLTGIKIKSIIGDMDLKAFYSSPQGTSKYYKSYGNNTQGPYYLGSSPVVVASEKVYLNGTLQVKEKDYRIDHETGEIVFLKRGIREDEIIEAYYDHMETLYEHSTFGLRVGSRVNENLKVAVSYIDDSDIVRSGGETADTKPFTHYIVGADAQYRDENTISNIELAYSRKDNDILDKDTYIDIGNAIKMDYEKSVQNMSGYFMLKRVDGGFHYVSDSNPKNDVWEYAFKVGYKPFSDLDLLTDYHYDKFRIGETDFLNENRSFGSTYSKDNYRINYHFSEEENSTDPVYDTPIARTRNRNKIELFYRYLFLDNNFGAELEQDIKKYPSNEATNYQTYNYGISTYGLERFTARANVLVRNKESEKDFTQSRIYDLDVSSTPVDGYFLAANMHRAEEEDASDTVSVSYQITPTMNVSTQGRYSISTLKEEIGGTKEAISKQAGMFDVALAPAGNFKLKYSIMPEFTLVTRSNKNIRDNFVNQYEQEYWPYDWLKTTFMYRTDNLEETDDTDPELDRVRHQRLGTSSNIGIKVDSDSRLSYSLNYSGENIDETVLDIAGSSSYIKTYENIDAFEALVNYRILDNLNSTFRYADSSRLTVSDSISENRSRSVDASLQWNMDRSWSFSGKLGFINETDLMAHADTYAISPAVGCSYRNGPLKVDGNLSYYKRYTGDFSEKTNGSLTLLYDINDDIHSVLKANQEISSNPDHRTTEVMGSVEIVF